MKPANFPKRKQARAEQAALRQMEANQRSASEQLNVLKSRLGQSRKERERLQKRIDNQ